MARGAFLGDSPENHPCWGTCVARKATFFPGFPVGISGSERRQSDGNLKTGAARKFTPPPPCRASECELEEVDPGVGLLERESVCFALRVAIGERACLGARQAINR